MRKKAFIIILVSILFACKESKSKNNITKKENVKELPSIQNVEITKVVETDNKQKHEDLLNKTFYMITRTDSMDLILHSCEASVNTIRVSNNSIEVGT